MGLLLLGCLGFIALAAVRGMGWLGLPFSCLLSLFLLFAGASDGAIIVACSVIAAAAAMSLPRLDRFLAAGAGSFTAVMLLYVLPQGGADNPLNFFFAACSAAFAVGGIISGLSALLSRSSAATSK